LWTWTGHDVRLLASRGQHHDGDVPGTLVAREDLADFEAVHSGKHQVEQYQVQGQ
jgi:hypothetical protein